MLEAALSMLNTGARIIICGAIDNYQRGKPRSPLNYQAIAGAHATITGFTVYHYRDRLPAARAQLRKWVAEGKLSRSALAVWTGLKESAPGQP